MENENASVNDMATTAGVVADLVSRHIKPQLVEVPGPEQETKIPLLVLPEGLTAREVKTYADAYRTAPERRRGTARLVELMSFIDHVKRFRDVDSALFALPLSPGNKTPTLTAVLDYHRANKVAVVRDSDDSSSRVEHVDGAPRFGDHRAVYTFPLSDEWLEWTALDGKPMDQGAFAAFIENRIIDVTDPDNAFSSAKKFAESLGIESFASPQRIRQLSLGLTVHVDERVTSKIDPSSGETTMLFQTEHNDDSGAPLAVPRAFLIGIPVFRAGEHYQLAVRLRYRASGGKVAWAYDIHDASKAMDDAFRTACEFAKENTGLPLFYGAPEVG